MATQFLSDLDLAYSQLKRSRLDNQTSNPAGLTAANQGFVYFRTDTHVGQVWNGTAYDQVSGAIVSATSTTASGTVQGVTLTLAAAGASRQDQTLSVTTTAASGAQAGYMTASDYTKLANSTATNVASAIVQRDGSGNFAAGVITASLTGTASNATNLNGQAASFYLSRANQTGTQLAATISDFDTQVRTSRLDQFAAPTSAVAFNNQRITGLADPTSAQDAATKNYVDSLAAGFDVKASARVATSSALPSNTYSGGVLTATANGVLSVDGVSVNANDRVLVKNEVTGANNGVYTVTSPGTAGTPYQLTRSSDFNANSGSTPGAINPGAFVFVEQGTVNASSAWVVVTQAPITVGTTSITFSQVGAQTTYLAGNGLSLTGNTFAVVGTANRITSSGAGVDIAATYVGQTSITTLGTIGTGTWQGTSIAVLYGGTGATTAAGARTNLGATTKATTTITGTGAATSFTATHNLGTANHTITMVDATGNVTYADFQLGTNADTITVSTAIANGVVYTLTFVG